MNVIEKIRNICESITDTDLENLRIEERLLYLVIRSNKSAVGNKHMALERMKVINERQLNILAVISDKDK